MKRLIIFFIVISCILLTALVYIKLGSKLTPTPDVYMPYSNVTIANLENYLQDTISDEYFYGIRPHVTEVTVVDGGNQEKYTTSGWEKSGVRLFAQAYYSVRGSQYTENNQLISYEVIGFSDQLNSESKAIEVAKKVFRIGEYSAPQRSTLQSGEKILQYYIKLDNYDVITGVYEQSNGYVKNWLFFQCRFYRASKGEPIRSCFAKDRPKI